MKNEASWTVMIANRDRLRDAGMCRFVEPKAVHNASVQMLLRIWRRGLGMSHGVERRQE